MQHSPEHYLEKDNAAGRIMAHARTILRLARRFEAIAPGTLARAARVANYKSGKIVIHADNGAVASKIRQLSQRLCDELSKGGVECTLLEVKVQPRQPGTQSTPSTQKPLNPHQRRTLQETISTLPPGPLRNALERLLERALTTE